MIGFGLRTGYSPKLSSKMPIFAARVTFFVSTRSCDRTGQAYFRWHALWIFPGGGHAMRISSLFFLLVIFVSGCSIKEREMDDEIIALSSDRLPYRPKAKDTLPVTDLKNAYFEYDKWLLREDARKALVHDAAWLRKNPTTKVQIEGYCDERGSYEYNLDLGKRRADAAREFLIKQGIDGSRLLAVGVGRIPGAGDNTRARNRRTGFVVLYEN